VGRPKPSWTTAQAEPHDGSSRAARRPDPSRRTARAEPHDGPSRAARRPKPSRTTAQAEPHDGPSRAARRLKPIRRTGQAEPQKEQRAKSKQQCVQAKAGRAGRKDGPAGRTQPVSKAKAGKTSETTTGRQRGVNQGLPRSRQARYHGTNTSHMLKCKARHDSGSRASAGPPIRRRRRGGRPQSHLTECG